VLSTLIESDTRDVTLSYLPAHANVKSIVSVTAE